MATRDGWQTLIAHGDLPLLQGYVLTGDVNGLGVVADKLEELGCRTEVAACRDYLRRRAWATEAASIARAFGAAAQTAPSLYLYTREVLNLHTSDLSRPSRYYLELCRHCAIAANIVTELILGWYATTNSDWRQANAAAALAVAGMTSKQLLQTLLPLRDHYRRVHGVNAAKMWQHSIFEWWACDTMYATDTGVATHRARVVINNATIAADRCVVGPVRDAAMLAALTYQSPGEDDHG